VSGQIASVALLAAAFLHLGFQLTVTAVVYPALVRAPDWSAAHGSHTRRITPLVVVVYGALVVGAGWALIATWLDGWTVIAVAAAAVAVATTAVVAGPTHGSLAAGRDDALTRRLVAADGVRTVAALIAAVAALVALLLQ